MGVVHKGPFSLKVINSAHNFILLMISLFCEKGKGRKGQSKSDENWSKKRISLIRQLGGGSKPKSYHGGGRLALFPREVLPLLCLIPTIKILTSAIKIDPTYFFNLTHYVKSWCLAINLCRANFDIPCQNLTSQMRRSSWRLLWIITPPSCLLVY